MQEKGVVASRNEIADSMDIPRHFLTKIAQQLSRAGFVEVVQGPKGGIRLTSSPKNLSLLDVVEFINGEIFLNDCIIRPESCPRSKTCSIHEVWERARKQLRDTLREATFEKMLQDGTCFNNDLEGNLKPKEEC
jgi:Rrf2 family protein